MQFTFLGTSAGTPTIERNVTSLALQFRERSQWFLFDCGEGTQQQILRTSLKLPKLSTIFVTHLHGDHCYGLFGLLSSRGLMSGSEKQAVTIVGPKGIEKMIETVLRLSYCRGLNYNLSFVEFSEAGQVYEDDLLSVKAIKLSHDVPSFAYYLEEKERPGELLVEKIRAAGLPPGPVYSKIKAGEDVEHEGTTFRSADFLAEPKRGRRVIIGGDNESPGLCKEYAQELDVMVHEATHTEAVKAGLSFRSRHSTVAGLAKFAESMKIKNLIMTHFSSRFSLHPKSEHPMSEVRQEAEEHYTGNLFLARDFNQYTLDYQGALQRDRK